MGGAMMSEQQAIFLIVCAIVAVFYGVLIVGMYWHVKGR